MNNLSVGMQCLIIGSPYLETESNIGKVVTLLEFVPKHEDYVITDTAFPLCPTPSDAWIVLGLGLVALFEDNTVKELNHVCIRQQYLMPLDPLKETEQDKQEALVF